MKVRRIDFSPDEWLGGTIALRNDERGLYITACALIYAHGGPIPIDALRSACQDHGNAFNRQLQKLLNLGKLIGDGQEITNKRCENELENARKRSENGSENVRKRWAKGEEKSPELANTNGLDNSTVLQRRKANHQPSTINHQIDDANASSGALGGVSNGRSGKRGSRLPADWQPDEDDREFARELGLSPGEVADEFRDYWIAIPGSKGCKVDWKATFRNRCRELAKRERGRPPNGPGGSGSGHSRIAAALDRVHLAPDVSGPH